MSVESLFKKSLRDRTKWREYGDLLWKIKLFNYENLSYFAPEAPREVTGEGYYPIEKIMLSKAGYTFLQDKINEPQWVQLWDFNYWEKDETIIERKVYLHIYPTNDTVFGYERLTNH